MLLIPSETAAQGGLTYGKVEGADPPVLAKRVQELANERLPDKEAVADGAEGVEPELAAKLKRLIRFGHQGLSTSLFVCRYRWS